MQIEAKGVLHSRLCRLQCLHDMCKKNVADTSDVLILSYLRFAVNIIAAAALFEEKQHSIRRTFDYSDSPEGYKMTHDLICTYSGTIFVFV